MSQGKSRSIRSASSPLDDAEASVVAKDGRRDLSTEEEIVGEQIPMEEESVDDKQPSIDAKSVNGQHSSRMVGHSSKSADRPSTVGPFRYTLHRGP